MKLKTIYLDGRNFVKVVPAKRLFNSTMVHEVCTRGDFFAVDIETGTLTVLAGHLQHSAPSNTFNITRHLPAQTPLKPVKDERAKLKELVEQMKLELGEH